MKVVVAEYSGFCFGVKRAVGLVEKTFQKRNNPVYSLGPFIHNPQVVEELSGRGLKVIKNLKNTKQGVMVIRSHGLHPYLTREAEKRSMELVDATCPHVKSTQLISKSLRDKGYMVIIVGEKRHPEVQALKGFARDEAIVVNSLQEVDKLPLEGRKVGILAQTTQSKPRFLKIVSHVKKRHPREVKVFDTICQDTIKRQHSVLKVARSVDLMLILGGKGSANTQRLAEMCSAQGIKVRHIEKAGEIDGRWLKGKRVAGIAGGASTPDWIIDEAVNKLKINSKY